jgi:hypothetical protein
VLRLGVDFRPGTTLAAELSRTRGNKSGQCLDWIETKRRVKLWGRAAALEDRFTCKRRDIGNAQLQVCAVLAAAHGQRTPL